MRSSDMTKDPLHLRHETLVCHAVCFVDRHHLDGSEVALTCLHQVDQPQRSGHHDFGALRQLLHLLVAIRAAIDREHFHPAVITDRPEHFGDLQGQFASRHEHEPMGRHLRRRRVDARHHRDTEGERLARTRARPAAHVVACECHGNGFLLNGERASKASSSKPFVDRLGHPEVGKSGGHTHTGGW